MQDDIGGASYGGLKGAVSVGDDLYGLSVSELQARISAFTAEITRIEAELVKKRAELSEAETLFGGSAKAKG